MFLILTFAGLAVGPFAGWLGGWIPNYNNWGKNEQQNRLHGGVLGWTLAAIAGTILGAIICCNMTGETSFQFLGLEVNGIIWVGWISSLVGGAIGVYTAVTEDLEPSRSKSR